MGRAEPGQQLVRGRFRDGHVDEAIVTDRKGRRRENRLRCICDCCQAQKGKTDNTLSQHDFC
jgi:hypothetical protein